MEEEVADGEPEEEEVGVVVAEEVRFVRLFIGPHLHLNRV